MNTVTRGYCQQLDWKNTTIVILPHRRQFNGTMVSPIMINNIKKMITIIVMLRAGKCFEGKIWKWVNFVGSGLHNIFTFHPIWGNWPAVRYSSIFIFPSPLFITFLVRSQVVTFYRPSLFFPCAWVESMNNWIKGNIHCLYFYNPALLRRGGGVTLRLY